MKMEITPRQNQLILSRYISGAYDSAPDKEPGSIQLKLSGMNETISCYYTADGTKMIFDFGELEKYDVKLTSSLYDWLDLANGKLNPVWGAAAGRLKFEGDVKVFGKLIRNDLMFKVNADVMYDPPTELEKSPEKKWKQPGKILIINGSPRGQKGYTFHYLNRFIKGLEKGGASIETIELGKKRINPCIGCFHCWKNNTGTCIQNDDVNALYETYNNSDLIIYAFTLYWDTVPGMLKNFIERAFCLEHPYMIPGMDRTRHPRRIKKDQNMFVFSVCGFPEQTHFHPVIEYFNGISHNAHIPLIGGIYRSACMFLPNDPLYYKTYRTVLDSIQDAGESLYKYGKIDDKTIKKIQTKINPDEFKIHANKFWENVISKDRFFVDSV